MRTLSRRGVARLGLRLVALWTTGAAAQSAGDRGLGGTGVIPADPDETVGQDRGIGGTGVVGTIRRFGSIVVNGLRVGYPAGVRVTIDGRSATAADLRIGQVVHVLAHMRGGGLETRAIAVTHEVVGRIERVDRAGLIVLGQTVLTGEARRGRFRRGDAVAVSGLRRFDGAIVASLVAPVPAGTPASLAGELEIGPDGMPRIGGIAIVGRVPRAAGRRVVLAGERIGDAFRASAVTVEPAVPFATAERLSIEGFVRRAGDEVRFGSGVALGAGRVGAELGTREMRAVVTATAAGRGTFAVTGVHRERGSPVGTQGAGEGAPSPERPAAVRQKAAAPSPAPAAPSHPSGGEGKKQGGGSR